MEDYTREFLNEAEFSKIYDLLKKTGNSVPLPGISEMRIALLGRISWLFQWIESEAGEFIEALLDCPGDQAKVMTSKLSYKHILTVLSTLAHAKSIPNVEYLDKVIISARKVEEVRNRVVHSVWSGQFRSRHDLHEKHGSRWQIEEFTDAELEEVVNRMQQVEEAMSICHMNYLDHWIANNRPSPLTS